MKPRAINQKPVLEKSNLGQNHKLRPKSTARGSDLHTMDLASLHHSHPAHLCSAHTVLLVRCSHHAQSLLQGATATQQPLSPARDSVDDLLSLAHLPIWYRVLQVTCAMLALNCAAQCPKTQCFNALGEDRSWEKRKSMMGTYGIEL